MNIKTLSGHLTQTNKKHIKAIFNSNLLEGKVNSIIYKITKNDNYYTAKITQNYSSTIGGEVKPHASLSEFKIV